MMKQSFVIKSSVMEKQTADSILMIRPVDFHFNAETAKNNYYQKEEVDLINFSPNELAQQEFDLFVSKLREIGVEVVVANDNLKNKTPDSIFPNNWVSFHQDGRVGLYPMFAENRRLERRFDLLDKLANNFEISKIEDFTSAEKEGRFLEGTGSMVLDREHKIAYAALSLRTDEKELEVFCKRFDFKPIAFNAFQNVGDERLPIYHTNVMMCVADKYAVLCADAIDNPDERSKVVLSLENSGKEIVYISENQKHNFAGNMLQLKNDIGEIFTVMSSSAFESLNEIQKDQLKNYGEIIHSSLSTIERLGGGSARCMMAEIFLPKKKK